MRKPVFGVCNQARLKPACAATEPRQRREISDIETRGIILSRQQTTKANNRFAHDGAHIRQRLNCPTGISFYSGSNNKIYDLNAWKEVSQ